MGAADNFFQKADQAIKRRNLDYAIELLKQGLAIDPDRLDERKKLRRAAVQRCHEKNSSTTGSKMLRLKNSGLLGKIKKLQVQKKIEELIIENEKFLALAPQDSKQLMVQGGAFETTERLDSALEQFRTITEIEPQNADAWKKMGRIFERLKKIDKAIECWEQVRSFNPADQEAGKVIRDLSAAKMMAQQEDRRKDGDDSFRSMLKDTDESAKLEKQQRIIRTADDAKDAIAIKREQVEADAENPRQWRELGDLYLKANDYDGAEQSYNKAIELNPGDLYLKDRLSKLTERRIQADVDLARAAVEKNPDDETAKAKLGEVEKRQNEFLLADLERQVNAHPTDYSLKYRFGEQLLKNERYDEAIAQFQKARQDPKFASKSVYLAGKSFAGKSMYGPAILQFKQALEAQSDKESDLAKAITYDLADAHDKQGEEDVALELLEGLMMVDIGYRDVSQKADEIRKRKAG